MASICSYAEHSFRHAEQIRSRLIAEEPRLPSSGDPQDHADDLNQILTYLIEENG